jgi:hypothetical protein
MMRWTIAEGRLNLSRVILGRFVQTRESLSTLWTDS